ncbi:hypothetical protein [Mucilaginibacter aquariorum]|uniref:Uncharacterized protein n=1 Tax=Mucilaginibacter aquariorum TaxID=2967225 RepID=A0ABT1SXH7_9SPHI|nr:hypothetical protein [Mucilaginibacter aquariorum]MCQ6957056.1 hypothetical protein [Mucilaginibacter aquariorum]
MKADITAQPPEDIFDLEQEAFHPAWFKALTYRYFLASQWMVAHLSKV